MLSQRITFITVIKNITAVDVTYKMPNILGKKSKPFSDVEVNECIVEALGSPDPEKLTNTDNYHLREEI